MMINLIIRFYHNSIHSQQCISFTRLNQALRMIPPPPCLTVGSLWSVIFQTVFFCLAKSLRSFSSEAIQLLYLGWKENFSKSFQFISISWVFPPHPQQFPFTSLGQMIETRTLVIPRWRAQWKQLKATLMLWVSAMKKGGHYISEIICSFIFNSRNKWINVFIKIS